MFLLLRSLKEKKRIFKLGNCITTGIIDPTGEQADNCPAEVWFLFLSKINKQVQFKHPG